MSRNINFLIAAVILVITGCNSETVAEKAKNTISNTGKSIGRGTSEFFKGVKEGVDKTLQCKLEVSPNLTNQGLGVGKFFISQSKGSRDNVLTVYLIFENDINKKISVKLYDKNGLEYGRTSTLVQGTTGDASNINFVFPAPTEIEAKSKFILQ